MPRGGARGRSGPAPDPNALRRDRKEDEAGWKTLPAERTEPAPDWPLTYPSPREVELWEREWRRPQAVEWERLGLENEVGLYVRAFAEAEQPGATANLRNYVRMTQENLGLSLPGLQRHRWRIAGEDDSPASAGSASASRTARPPARSSASARERFRIVPPAEGAS